jgi:hypothetical protein
MVDTDNKLRGVTKLRVPSSSIVKRTDRVGRGDLDDLYYFRLSGASDLNLTLSGIEAGADVDVQIYRLKRHFNQVPHRIGRKDFRRLSTTERDTYLQLIPTPRRGGNQNERTMLQGLEAGGYIVHVLQRRGNSRYQLTLANAPVSQNNFLFSYLPDDSTYNLIVDFSKDKDTDSREEFGLFRGAALGIFHDFGNDIGVSAEVFQMGDVIAFRNDDGETEYRAKLISEYGSNILYAGLKVSSEVEADPDSLSSLKELIGESIDMQDKPAITFAYLKDENDLDLKSVELGEYYSFMEEVSSYYILSPNQQDLTLNKSSVVIGNALNNTITATNDGDDLLGRSGNDILQGGTGNDRLNGGTGNDILTGGAGNDDLNGEAGSDRLTGGAGSDSYYVDNSRDIITESLSARGTDTVFAHVSWTLGPGLENLELQVSNSNAVIFGIGNELNNTINKEGDSSLQDSLFLDGKAGNDSLFGSSRDDRLVGGSGNDILDGGHGSDYLFGGEGSDRLNGYGKSTSNDAQYDTLIGGGGTDSFILGGFWGVSYSESDGDGYAAIRDWQPGVDAIEVSGTVSQYSLVSDKSIIGSSALDTEIFYSNGDIYKRIAIIQDTINVSIPRDFRFI